MSSEISDLYKQLHTELVKWCCLMAGSYDAAEELVQDGASITVNGILKIAPKTEEILKKYENITANGVILCPKSIASILPLPGLTLNDLTKAYPDDYTLLDNKYKLDKYFPMRVENGKGYVNADYYEL